MSNPSSAETSLGQRFCQDIELCGKSERTKKSYRLVFEDFARFIDVPVEQADDDHLRGYMLQLVNGRKLKASSLRVYTAGLKLLFNKTLRRPMPVLTIVKPKPIETIPVVLSREEVTQLLATVKKPSLKTILTLNYTCGLRLSEATQLSIDAIDSQRMMVIVRGGKGQKDRQVPLPHRTLERLRDHYRCARPQGPYLFCGKTAKRPLHITSVQRGFKRALKDSGITKAATVHSLRHSYATHLLEDGVSLRAIQLFLGHKKIQVTVRYVHLTELKVERTRKIIESLGERI